MIEPGWYNAQGDAPGIERYWDGTGWVGEPRYAPSIAQRSSPGPAFLPSIPPPVGAGAPVAPVGYPNDVQSQTQETFPDGLQVLSLVVSITKMVPLLFGVFVAMILGSFRNFFRDASDSDVGGGLGGAFDDAVDTAFIMLVLFLLAGGVLLVTQLVGAVRRKLIVVIVPAVIMSILDVLLTVWAWNTWNQARDVFGQSNDPMVWCVVITSTAVAQVTIAVMAIRALSRR